MAQQNATMGTAQPALTEQQARAVELVAAGRSLGDVAREVGVDRATLWRWRRAPVFVDAVAALRIEARIATVGTLRANAMRAAQVIRELLDDPAAPHQVRLSAAKTALEVQPSYYVGEQIDALERETAEPVAGLVIETARRVAGLNGRTGRDLNNCHTAAQYWAAARLPERAYRHLERLEAKGDLAAASDYCARLVDECRAELEARAFGHKEDGEDNEDGAV